jgi:hypothetical protein
MKIKSFYEFVNENSSFNNINDEYGIVYNVVLHIENDAKDLKKFSSLKDAKKFVDNLKRKELSLDDRYHNDTVTVTIEKTELENDGDIIDSEEVYSKNFPPVNYKSDKLLDEFRIKFVDKYYGGRSRNYYDNYFEIDLFTDVYDYDIDVDNDVSVEVRISDHSENPDNIDRYGIPPDYHISIVIADKDITFDKFYLSNTLDKKQTEVQVWFDSDSTVNEIMDWLKNTFNKIKKIETSEK